MGYYRDTTYTLNSGYMPGFYVMNPQDGAIRYNTYTEPKCYFYRNHGVDRYEWDNSIVLKQNLLW